VIFVQKGLSPADQQTFDTLMQYARQHALAGSLAARLMITETIFIGISIR
jgi:hypothetical protein